MFGEWSGEGTLKVKDEEKAFEVKAVRGRKAGVLLLGVSENRVNAGASES